MTPVTDVPCGASSSRSASVADQAAAFDAAYAVAIGKWSLYAGDSYFDHTMDFLAHAPGLPLEIGFQTDYTDRVATLAKLRDCG